MKKEESSETKTQTKRRLLRVEGVKGQSVGYGLSSFNFAFVGAPVDGKRYQASGHLTCREYLNWAAWASFNKVSKLYFDPSKDVFVDFDCLRILFVYSPSDVAAFKKRLFNGKAALNLMEDVAGWKQSRITTVVHANYKNAWLLTGPGEWMSQPQLVSLMSWIMRLSSFESLDVKNYDALEYCLKRLHENSGGQDAHTYNKKFWNRMYIILKFHKEIFDGITLERAWPSNANDYFGQKSGLLSFVNDGANYSNEIKEAKKRFEQLCKEHLPRKNPLIK